MEPRPSSQFFGHHRQWQGRDWTLLVLVTALAAVLRLWALAFPHTLVFDETYYAKDACFYVFASEHVCGVGEEKTAVHPPLGKWLIAAGIAPLGYDSFSWRIAAAAAGTATVALLYLLARKVTGSSLAAVVSAGLLAIDLLHLVQSRVAMLDVFVPFFGVGAFLCLAYDRDRIAAPASGNEPRSVWSNLRGWRLLAGVLAGAAVASKWSGVLVLAALWLLTLAWEVGARRDRTMGTRAAGAAKEVAITFAWLCVVPLAVYCASYTGILDGALLALPWQEGSWVRAFVDRQQYMFDFHYGLNATHAYESPPWSWLLLKRPVSYYFDTTSSGDYREIMAFASPLVWWASLVALGVLFVRWLPRRDYMAPEGLILCGFALSYFPWFRLASGREAVFLFYVLPAVPFMCLALGRAAQLVASSIAGKAAVAVFACAAVALFGFYWPLVTGIAIPRSSWDARIWRFTSCDKPPPVKTTVTSTQTVKGTPRVEEKTTRSDENLPPKGWCWI
jgi:dolichyl-phosphate-mannose--protein O-mannosyl transferase